MQLSQTLSSAIAQIKSFKQPNYKSHKKDFASAPYSFFQFLYNLKINFFRLFFKGEGFPAFYKGRPGVFPRKTLENLECRKSIYHIFRLILYIFYFSLISFIFFCYSLKLSGYSLYFKPALFLISNYFAYYSLISLKNGHYSLINKPHPDPLVLAAYFTKKNTYACQSRRTVSYFGQILSHATYTAYV